MSRGGIHDQVGGGFHRYSVDARWAVPHFEKMLYDNAQLAPVYLHAYQVSGRDDMLEACTRTLDYMARELLLSGGAFAASQDADSPGGEGAFFVWTPAQLRDALGADDGALAARAVRRRRRRQLRARDDRAVDAVPAGAGGAVDVDSTNRRCMRVSRTSARACAWRAHRVAAPAARRQGDHRVERARDHAPSPRRAPHSSDPDYIDVATRVRRFPARAPGARRRRLSHLERRRGPHHRVSR